MTEATPTTTSDVVVAAEGVCPTTKTKTGTARMDPPPPRAPSDTPMRNPSGEASSARALTGRPGAGLERGGGSSRRGRRRRPSVGARDAERLVLAGGAPIVVDVHHGLASPVEQRSPDRRPQPRSAVHPHLALRDLTHAALEIVQRDVD